VQRDAKIGAVLDQLVILASDRRMAGLGPVCQLAFNGDFQALQRAKSF
jgi:hypothetical protein